MCKTALYNSKIRHCLHVVTKRQFLPPEQLSSRGPGSRSSVSLSVYLSHMLYSDIY